MTRQAALKLHNGDQVERKYDGAILRVLRVRCWSGKTVYIEAYEEASGAYATVGHTRVR